MAVLTANGVGVIDGTITMPQIGVWIADLVLDQPDGNGFSAGTKVSLQATGGIALNGVVDPSRTGDFLDAVHVRVLGGAGGTEKVLQPKGYSQPSAFVRDVLKGLANDSGEALSDTIDSSLLGTNLTAWNTVTAPMSSALVTLINFILPGMSWRILADGTLWVGEETWDAATFESVEISRDPKEGRYEFGVDSPSIVPGVTIEGVGKVAKVDHSITSDKLRSTVWVQLEDEQRGIRAAIGAMVRQEMNGIDYLAMYDAKVVSQSPHSTTVDLQPVDKRLPGLQRIPLRLGLPGCKVTFSPGAFVRLGWDRGNPALPFACLWNGGETVQLIELAGTRRVARLDDTTTNGTIEILGGIGSSFTGIKYISQNGTITTINATGIQATIQGAIDSASTIVKVA